MAVGQLGVYGHYSSALFSPGRGQTLWTEMPHPV
jgi:hypothetical protein